MENLGNNAPPVQLEIDPILLPRGVEACEACQPMLRERIIFDPPEVLEKAGDLVRVFQQHFHHMGGLVVVMDGFASMSKIPFQYLQQHTRGALRLAPANYDRVEPFRCPHLGALDPAGALPNPPQGHGDEQQADGLQVENEQEMLTDYQPDQEGHEGPGQVEQDIKAPMGPEPEAQDEPGQGPQDEQEEDGQVGPALDQVAEQPAKKQKKKQKKKKNLTRDAQDDPQAKRLKIDEDEKAKAEKAKKHRGSEWSAGMHAARYGRRP